MQAIANGTHFPTVGHPTSIGFRLGPIYYYTFAPLVGLFNEPQTIGYISVFVSIITMLLVYKIGKRISVKTGLVALMLYSYSYLNVLYERRGWQLSFEGILIAILVYSLIRLAEKRYFYIFPLTISLIYMTQIEIGLFTFIPLTVFFFLLRRINVPIVFIAISLTAVLIANSGLLVFDLRHQFLNTRYLVNYFRHDQTIRIAKNIPLTGIRASYLAHNLIPSTLARLTFPFSQPNVAVQYANCPQYLTYKQSTIPLIAKLVVIVVFLYALVLFFKNYHLRSESSSLIQIVGLFLFIHTFAIALYTYVFHGEMAEYYIQPLFLFFFLHMAIVFTKLSRSSARYVVYLGLILFIFINMQSLFNSFNPYGYSNKRSAILYSLNLVKNKPFNVESAQTCWYTGGYRYLYSMYGKNPVRSYMDEYLQEYYSPNDQGVEYSVSLLTPELIGANPKGYQQYETRIKQLFPIHQTFGAIKVYIKPQ